MGGCPTSQRLASSKLTEIEKIKASTVPSMAANSGVPSFRVNNDGGNLTDQALKPSEVGLSGQAPDMRKHESG
jgi:hypothetical protein